MIRTVTIDNEPWWVLKDVCNILRIENHKEVQSRLDDDEVGRFDLPHPQSETKKLEMICVNESGLYTVILRSDKPEAKTFRKWVTSEVLPSIRKMGSYNTELEIQQEFLVQQFQTVITQNNQILQAIQQSIQAQQPQPIYPQRHTPFKTRIFAKLNLLSDHYKQPFNALIHNAIIELEDTYDISLSDYKSQYLINTRLLPEEAQALDVIEYNPDIRKLFELTLNNILEQNGIPYQNTARRKNIFTQTNAS